ncbi:GNAT family N-acetyltransferase [Caryophanon latum]|uniref:Benzoate transporter n=1 Tax=Caryophanon latum TaxID=33977 RepID=A0A1C0YDH1_9BACL|nr:GNAT family N-acetyltransferase [Caryophanon latum]OCS85222.1 benzoate transporter [Caryophanon latum]
MYDVQKLTLAHIPQLQTLQQQVIDALPDKTMLQPLDESELRFILEGNGVMIGLFADEQLIAFRALLEPPIDDEHLGRDIGHANLDEVLYQEISNVHPDHRGQGLQQQMAQHIMQYVDTNKHKIVCATVMPFNIASLKDKFAQRMHVAALKLKYGGKLRYVFAKSLVEETAWEDEAIVVPMGETEAQQQLLRDGYFGVSMERRGDGWFVLYKKRTKHNFA